MSTPILKSLKADPDYVPPMGEHQPTNLEGTALAAWDYFAEDPPYWWTPSDFMTVERYCVLIGAEHDLRTMLTSKTMVEDFDRYQDVLKMLKQLSLELKAVEYALGVTPQSRAALKLADSGAAKARGKRGEAKEEKEQGGKEPIAPEDL